MRQKKYKWYKIADNLQEIEFSKEGFAIAEVDNKKFCIVLFKGELYACNAKCPHAGGALADGYVDGLGNIVCPVHRYKFNLLNGRNSSGEGYFLKTYPVEKRNEAIFIGIAENGLLNWLK